MREEQRERPADNRPARPGPLDRALDWLVVPGFSALGFRARSRGWPPPTGLEGSTVLVTGASSGLGAAAAEMLAAAGASVQLLVRDAEKGERVRAEIGERVPDAATRVWRCDVSDLGSIRSFAAAFSAEQPRLDALVNNAGAMPPERRLSADGFELTFATNVLGPFLLTALLLPALRAAGGRVVNVSSGGLYTAKLDAADPQLERKEYDPPRFYAHTKRCEVVLTELWQERVGDGASFHSMHPGWADTPGVRASLPRFRRLMAPVLRDARQGADTIVWLCWAPEPLAEPGRFWHDRAPRPTHKVPWTREGEAERERLWSLCAELSGCDPREIEGG